MVVHEVFEDDPHRQAMLARQGFSLLPGSRDHLDVGGDVAVLCRDDCCVPGVPVVYAAHLRSLEGMLFSPCSPADETFNQPCIHIALPDVIALGRIFQVLTPLAGIERLFANTIVRAGHATQRSGGSVDALEPLPEDADMTRQMDEAFGRHLPHFQLRQVRASYSHSHLHTLKLDLDRRLRRQDVLAVFSGTSRVLLGAAADGFATTADVQEFFRNSMRRRGDRPELFVWEESVMVNGQQLYLMMDVCQEATSVLETVDAIRLQQIRLSDATEAIRRTDCVFACGTSLAIHLARACNRQRVMNSTARVGILGYGVIGRRVADAVRAQRDMTVVGVAARPTSFSLRDALLQGYDIYLTDPPQDGDSSCRWGTVSGYLDDLLPQCDVLLDCTPSGNPRDRQALYDSHPHLTVIVQGGEKHSFGGVSFNAFANYAEAAAKKRIRVISCSSTGTARFVFGLDQAFGLRRAFVALTRRAADPGKASKTPHNALKPTMGPSHHAPDVQTVLPQLELFSMSVDVPTTFGHVLNFQADVQQDVNEGAVIEALNSLPRVVVGRGLNSTAELAEYYQDLGRRRRDRPEIYVWEGSVKVVANTVYATISVHMESITIPETVDCIRAALEMEPDNWVSIYQTDRALGIAKTADCYRRRSRGRTSTPMRAAARLSPPAPAGGWNLTQHNHVLICVD